MEHKTQQMPTAGVASEKTLPPELLPVLGRIAEVNSLPEVAAKIVEVVEDPRSSVHDLHRIVRCDPALAAKILKVVNSAFYGLPSQVASLDRAILLLGLTAVKNIALAASLSRLFSPEGLSEQLVARELWRHSLAVAVCSRLVAQIGGRVSAEEALVAGLVHDMGLMVVHQFFRRKLREVIERCQRERQAFCAIEQEVLKTDHQVWGAALAAKWKFPASLRQTIAYHHEPSLAPIEHQCISTVVYVADTLCGESRLGFFLTTQGQETPESAWQTIGLEPQFAERVRQELPQGVREAEQVFGE